RMWSFSGVVFEEITGLRPQHSVDNQQMKRINIMRIIYEKGNSDNWNDNRGIFTRMGTEICGGRHLAAS
ncbi:MAG: hypothetical protein K2H85_05085, partial [Allobaculum sp.]|nr:hypothetical protein [Allobaculum sp.]